MVQDWIPDKLFPIIRSAFGIISNRPLLSGTDYELLIQFGTRQSIISVIWKGLNQLNYTNSYINQFDEARLKDIRNFIVREHAYNSISSALDMAGISYIPLKGAVIKHLYPDPYMRTSCDIDILVHEEDLPKAIKAIESKTDYVAGKRGYHDISMTNTQISLELHFSIKEGSDSIDQLLEKAWDYAKPSGIGSSYLFTSEFHIFYILAHMSYHLKKGGLGIRPFLDLWVLREKTDFEEEELKNMCSRCGLLTFYEKSCELLNAWMYAKKYTPEAKALEQYCFMGGVYGNSEIASAAVLRKNRGVRYVLRRLFIKKKILQEIYPKLRDVPFLLPYYQIKRWSSLFDVKKRDKYIRELKGVHVIDKKQIDSFDQLMTNLGL